jgi:hypothetical protein
LWIEKSLWNYGLINLGIINPRQNELPVDIGAEIVIAGYPQLQIFTRTGAVIAKIEGVHKG